MDQSSDTPAAHATPPQSQLRARSSSFVRSAIGALQWHAVRAWHRVQYFGRRIECPCCERRFRAFRPHPWGPSPDYPGICPSCEAYERHRALLLYLREQTEVFRQPVDVLECAPFGGLTRQLKQRTNGRYVSVDLESPLAEIKADVTALPFPSGEFDVVLCSHVLEHVEDDRRAARELARVLRPDGFAVIIVPIHRGLSDTFEDPSITTPEERLTKYGQADHVRIYGRDFPARLTQAGFSVERINMFELVSGGDAGRWGLSRYDDIWVARPVATVRA
jgi:SAM-dependent methyltransferase